MIGRCEEPQMTLRLLVTKVMGRSGATSSHTRPELVQFLGTQVERETLTKGQDSRGAGDGVI